MHRQQRLLELCTGINAAVMTGFAFVFGLFPFGYVVANLGDPALQAPGMPRSAEWIHKRLSPRFETWARERVASKRATELTTDDLVETEWPLFGGAFYLWATEALEERDHLTPDPVVASALPSRYAAGAIGAAAALMTDPAQATWVKQHWGEDYLERENVFYRMLLLAGMTSYRNLTGSNQYNEALALQARSLERSLAESPYGLLDDYPAECYPGDVLAGIAAILRTGAPLSVDRETFLRQTRRGFEGNAVDKFGLPPFLAFAQMGDAVDGARGSSNSYLTFVAPEVWPDKAQAWYALHEKYFWQENAWMAGFREYPRDAGEPEWSRGDMDSGPILGGYGMAACAFALAAARSNGRYDHAYPLAAEMLAASWPLPDGTLLLPRMLSCATDAPYLGEAAILFNLTRQPVGDVTITKGGRIPGLVYGILASYLLASGFVLLGAWLSLRRVHRAKAVLIPWPKLQLGLWILFLVAGLVILYRDHSGTGLLVLLLGQFLPRARCISWGKA